MARAKEDLHEKVKDVKEKVSPTRLVRRPVEAVKQGVHSVMGSESNSNGNGAGVLAPGRRQTPDSASSAREQSQGLAARAGDAAGSVADSVRGAPGAAREKAEGNPLAAGILAVAAGFFAASLLPPTRREQQLVGQARERIEPFKEQAIAAGARGRGRAAGDRSRRT